MDSWRLGPERRPVWTAPDHRVALPRCPRSDRRRSMTCRARTASACSPPRPAGTRPRRTAIPTCSGTFSSGRTSSTAPSWRGSSSTRRAWPATLVGAADTRAFEAWAEGGWWPVLRAQYPQLGDGTRDAEVIELIQRPHPADAAIVASSIQPPPYQPARTRPWTRAWTDAGRVARRGAPLGQIRGVHLDVGASNRNAIAFYRHPASRRSRRRRRDRDGAAARLTTGAATRGAYFLRLVPLERPFDDGLGGRPGRRLCRRLRRRLCRRLRGPLGRGLGGRPPARGSRRQPWAAPTSSAPCVAITIPAPAS